MIQTESGYVSGLTTKDEAVSIFKGIPFAAPPIGNLRWNAPTKSPSWPGVRECTKFSPSAIQSPQAPFLMWSEEFIIDTSTGYSEDCLTLNVYCPSDVNVKDKPVVIYFHGGSFVAGGSSCEIYNGEQLARNGVIFVTANFRVGILGLLASSELSKGNPRNISGNYQLLDQIAALKWVRDNIEAFGGNPENVTIMGQSSGAAAVCTLAVSPMAKGLFRRVFAMSHETLNMPVATTSDASGKMIMVDIYKPLSECEREGDEVIGMVVEDMRTMTTEELLKLPAYYPYCIDGHVLTCPFNDGVRAGMTDEYDFMVTYTANDNMLFMIMRDLAAKNPTTTEDYEAAMRGYFGEHADMAMKLYPFNGNPKQFVSMISHERYTASVMMLASLRKGAKTWIAQFDHVMPGPESHIWGAFHTSDVPYWLDYFSDKRKDLWREEDYSLGAELVARLAAYAKTGSPNAEGLSDWKPSDGNSIYRIQAGNIHEAQLLTQEKYDFWREVYCVN
ncbi:MAG: carboxylesterase family protein [Synergistaceae bacterium]|nr:carboxylesterase family protein [Synergistaceae bacterium]